MRVQIFTKTALFDPLGNVLLLRRSPTDARRPGEWDMPGGAIEDGEELNSGAAREVFEESGIVVDPLRLQLVYGATAPYMEESNTRLLFLTKTDTIEVVLSDEHDLFRWVDVQTAIAEFPHPVYSAALVYARDNGLLSTYSVA